MIQILFVFGGIPHLGGTEAVMKNIYDNIDLSIYHIDFCFFGAAADDQSNFTKDALTNSNVYYVPLLRNGIHQNHLAIKKIFRQKHYDIVHTHMDASGWDVHRLAKREGVTVRVAHSHNTSHIENPQSLKEKIHRIYLETARRLLRHYATHYIGCSNAAGLWLFGEKICRGKRYLTFRNAIDTERYEFSQQIRERIRAEHDWNEFKVIGHVGRFSEQKNHSFLIDIFHEVYCHDKSYKLVLVGIGEKMEEIRRKVQSLDMEDAVVFLGNRSDVNEILQGFDVLLMPSLYEGLSIAMVEAQAAGLTCFVSDTVTKETNITGNVKFISLESSPSVWANEIENELEQGTDRFSPIQAIKSHGFDIKTNIRELERFYSLSRTES